MGRDQKGFGVIEIILILVLVGILGFVGWSVYNNLQQTNVTNKATIDASNQTVNQKETTIDADGYFVIKEWGVRFKPVDNSLTIMAQKRANTSANPGVEIYNLTAKEIDEHGGHCTQESGFLLAALSRSKTLQDEACLA